MDAYPELVVDALCLGFLDCLVVKKRTDDRRQGLQPPTSSKQCFADGRRCCSGHPFATGSEDDNILHSRHLVVHNHHSRMVGTNQGLFWAFQMELDAFQ